MKLPGHKGFNYRKLAQQMTGVDPNNYVGDLFNWVITVNVYRKYPEGSFPGQSPEATGEFDFQYQRIVSSDYQYSGQSPISEVGTGPFTTEEQATTSLNSAIQMIDDTKNNPVLVEKGANEGVQTMLEVIDSSIISGNDQTEKYEVNGMQSPPVGLDVLFAEEFLEPDSMLDFSNGVSEVLNLPE